MTCVTKTLTRGYRLKFKHVLEAGNDIPLENVTSCDVKKLITLLKLERHSELIVFQTNASGTFQEAACIFDTLI
jgi:hypothetical protein